MMDWLKPSTKMMGAGIALSLGWLLFEGCGCDESKEDRFGGVWVACIGNKPTLMRYSGDIPVTQDSANFDPGSYDCTHPNSPAYKGSGASPYPISSISGPARAKPAQQTRPAASGIAFLPPRLRDLPFLPPIPVTTPAGCDSSSPDVLQTVHTRALVTRFATCPFQIKTTIPVVSRPLEIAITPDGTTALVTSFDNAVNFIDLGSNQVTFTLRTDSTINPHGIAISPDGSRAYVSSFNSNNSVVVTIDLATRKIIASISVDAFPQGMTLTPDGSQLWVVHPLGQAVDVIDTLTNTLTTRLGIGQATDVAFNATGTRAYVTGAGGVFAVDASTYKTIKTYTVGTGPTDIQMAYGDEFLVVNNSGSNSISVIDLVKDKVSTASVSGVPSGIVFVH